MIADRWSDVVTNVCESKPTDLHVLDMSDANLPQELFITGVYTFLFFSSSFFFCSFILVLILIS